MRTALWRWVFVLAAALMLPAGAARASAGADVLRFDFTTPIDDFVPADDCRPDVSVTVTGTERLAGQRVDLADGSMLFRGEITDAITVRFSDGSFGVGGSTERFAGPFVVLGPDHARAVVTFNHRDSITVFDASGRPIGTETFRVVEHSIVDDFAPFGPSDNDVLRLGFEHPHLSCDF